VTSVIRHSLPASLELGVVALALAAVVGLAVGFSGIARPEGKLDLGGRLYASAPMHCRPSGQRW